MASSVFSSALQAFDKRGIGEIATKLGESEQSVTRGLESSVAAILSGLGNRAGDAGLMRQVIDLAGATPANIPWASQVGRADSPLLAEGKRLTASVFGAGETSVMGSIGRISGLGPKACSALMAVAAPAVLTALGKRARESALTPTTLGGMIERESATMNEEAPAVFASTVTGATYEVRSASPVVAQAVIREEPPPVVVAARPAPVVEPPPRIEPVRSSFPWALAGALGALLLGLFFWRSTRDSIPAAPDVARTATRAVEQASAVASNAAGNLGEFVKKNLPGNVNLNIPERGVEARLLAFIQDPNSRVEAGHWFDFDRLLFDTGSAVLRPESHEQLRNVAAIMKAYPQVKLEVGGFTDNVGAPEDNLKLSQDRADAVIAELGRLGIDASRFTAKGYGEANPVADNSTEEGRARNRRVSMRVTAK